MLVSHASRSRRPIILQELHPLLELWDSLDSSLLQLIRDHRYTSPDLIQEEYRDIINTFFTKNGFDEKAVDALLQDRRVLARFMEQNLDVGLEVQIGQGCRWVEYRAPEGTLRIDPAALMWDCTCELTKEGYQRDPHCPLHSDVLAETITARFEHTLVQIHYDGTSVYWQQKPEFWPPSVDAIHMIETLDKLGVFAQTTPRVLDLGCGTGILGIAAAKRNATVVSITFSDWLMTPLFWTAVNWATGMNERHRVSVVFKLALNTNWKQRIFVKCPFDLVLCNPPYLPIPDRFPQIPLSNTVGGTELLEHIIRRGPELAPRVYIAFSNLASHEAERAARESGNVLEQVSDSHPVPFRVRHAMINKEYLHWLKERGLQVDETQRHRYWHSVAIYTVQAGTRAT